jgi:hypothetical protein
MEEGARSFIWVGSVGIKGGMYQEEDDNNNKSNRSSNRNNSKAEVIPSDLSGLKWTFCERGNLAENKVDNRLTLT